MKVLVLVDDSVASGPLAHFVEEIRAGLSEGDVEVRVVPNMKVRGRRVTTVLDVGPEPVEADVVVTVGWHALWATEGMSVTPDVHVLAAYDPSDPGPVTDDEGTRRRLINRARQIVTISRHATRALRSFGRFPRQLAAADGSSKTIVRPPGLGIADWLAAVPRSAHDEISLSDALSAAAERSIADLPELLDWCLDGRHIGRIQTINLQHVYLAGKSVHFRETIATADAVTADGWPIVELLKSRGRDVSRVTGADLVSKLLDDPRARGLRVALVGGAQTPGDAFERVAAEAGATLVFREHGDKRDWDPTVLAAALNTSGASLALVAVTQPAGDELAAELVRQGYHGVAVGIGAAVELFVGGEKRASPLLQKLRLEWLYRFMQDPRRLWRRYFVEGIPTYVRVVRPLTRQGNSKPHSG